MTDISRHNQQAYDRIVLEYARRNHLGMPENLAALAGWMMEHVGEGLILDGGCGTGRDMAYFEAHGARVVGADLSAGMLAYARSVAYGPLCQTDLRRLPFPPAVFDAAWYCASLLHFPRHELPLALAALRRVLKPGGLWVIEVQAGSGEGMEESYVPGVWRFFARYQPEEMRRILEDNGLPVDAVAANHSGGRDWLSFSGFRPADAG